MDVGFVFLDDLDEAKLADGFTLAGADQFVELNKATKTKLALAASTFGWFSDYLCPSDT